MLTLFRLGGLCLAAAACVPLAGGGRCFAQEDQIKKPLKVLWIYKGANSKENAINSEKMQFLPFDLFPKSAKAAVTFNHQLAAKSLPGDADATGTICQFNFDLKPSKFAGIRFTSDGEPAGEHPGIDVTKELGQDDARPAFLEFEARTAEGKTAQVDFKIGGVAGPNHQDGTEAKPWRFPEAISVKLTGKWQPYSIPLKGKTEELKSVVAPLTIAVDGSENGGTLVIVYLRSLRFVKW